MDKLDELMVKATIDESNRGITCQKCTYENVADCARCWLCEHILIEVPESIPPDPVKVATSLPEPSTSSLPVVTTSIHPSEFDKGIICDNCTYENKPKSVQCWLCEYYFIEVNDETQHSNSSNVVEVQTPFEVLSSSDFKVLQTAPSTHKFYHSQHFPHNLQTFNKKLASELNLFCTSLPSGVWIRAYEDRSDLLSVMIAGPEDTPYEDGIFLFDFQLPSNYPNHPPLCRYISQTAQQINPYLQADGYVCLPLLGTMPCRYPSEQWGPKSTLLQVIIAFQTVVLIQEPYMNEPHWKSECPLDNRSWIRDYNELIIVYLVQSMVKLNKQVMENPQVFRSEILEYSRKAALNMFNRFHEWLSTDVKTSFLLRPLSDNFEMEISQLTELFR